MKSDFQMQTLYETPPIVLDTNVLVAGACRRASSLAYRVLLGVLRRRVPLVVTPDIALEYQDVLLRPGVIKLTGLTHEQSVDLVADIIAIGRRVQVAFEWRPNLKDEADNKFVDAAIQSAAIIVTYNVRDYRDGDLTPYGWVAMTPQEFLTRYLFKDSD